KVGSQMKLEHKIALVTGAGSGIGRQTAITFSKEGAMVVLCDISAKAVAETEREITAAGNAALALQMDVTSEADWQRVATAVQEKFGMLHVFFNNGITRRSAYPSCGYQSKESRYLLCLIFSKRPCSASSRALQSGCPSPARGI
ncbi:MAG: SDR family NAD(P)-dependent oxidoreductase, partial [Ruthenibacterium sp.]